MKNGYRHLSLEERGSIAARLRRGESLRAIAKALGRSHATLIRELRRNGERGKQARYRHRAAQSAARVRRSAASRRRRLKSRRLRAYVSRQLRQGWSPQRIAAATARLDWGESVSHEAVYQWIRAEAPHLARFLARGPKRPRRAGGRR